ncbi:MAG: LysM peptidoglycan-binding domain-containing protein [Chloroflexi bacterium]|nr:LysM peptidoglycan-binding domain-containing protein [Chloroflexota bacterium]
MDGREVQNGRDRRRALRPGAGERPSTRRGYTFPRAEHRHPVYGRQARRESRQMPYIIGFIVVVLGLAGFLYVGLNWATGPGRVAALANPPTPTAIAVLPPPTAEPSPTPASQTYIVQAGDSPASIAAKFKIKTEDLVAANNIDDPQKLQIGQKLQIPLPATGH